jgi:hypothetical protein
MKWTREVNQCLQQLRDRVIITRGGASKSSTSSSSGCAFGEIETSTDDPPVTSIRGGMIVCGDKNYNVASQPLDLETDGQWLVEIEVTGVTAATDDDGEIFLPGCTTATDTAPAWANNSYTGSENYTDTTNPSSPASPTGTAIIGVGLLTIADGVATMSPTGCGTIRITQCAGIIEYSRG